MQTNALARADFSAIPVVRAADLKPPSSGGSWSFSSLVGLLSEISEETPCGALSFAAEIILEAQACGEPVAWVAAPDSTFFPPDLELRGIDLSAVALVRTGEGASGSLAAAEWLARSGAIGLLIVDCAGSWNVEDSALGRVQKLAERGQCAVVFLTRKPCSTPSLGSRISVRGCVSRAAGQPFLIDIHSAKDKRSVPGPRFRRCYHAPPGLR